MKRVILCSENNLMIRDGKGNSITIDELCDASFYDKYGHVNTFSGVSIYKDGKEYCWIFKSKGSGYERGGDTEKVITRTPKKYLYYCEFYDSDKRKRFKTIEDIRAFLYTI